MKNIMEIFASMSYGPALDSPAQAQAWAQGQQPFQLYIANQWVAPATGAYREDVDPAHGETLARVAVAGQADVEQAVAAAQSAFPSWSKLSGHARARYLYALARHLQKNTSLLALLETLDGGRAVREARGELPQIARIFYYYAGWAQLAERELADYRPLGVVAQVLTGDQSLLQLAQQVAPALAMGNTVVIKPGYDAPLAVLKFAEIVHEVGLPAGVVNVITGEDQTLARALATHSAVATLSFTGSITAGRDVRKASAGTGKRLYLHLDSRAPFIICEDADLDSAVEGLVDAAWSNQGTTGNMPTRLLVQENIAPILLEKLRTRIEHLRSGDPLDRSNDRSRVLSATSVQASRALVEQGRQEGLQYWQPSWATATDTASDTDTDTESTEPADFPPTIFFNVAPASQLAQADIPGPILLATTFRTLSEAVQLANHTPYGLRASVWSENIDVALDAATTLRASTVWINSVNLEDAAVASSEQRASGSGVSGGKESLYAYACPSWSAPVTPTATTPEVAGQDALDHADFVDVDATNSAISAFPPIDRTPKLFIGGKQTRPDSGYNLVVHAPGGRVLGEVGDGNRKDIRNAVEAAHKAAGWSGNSAHSRAQILYYIAENLAVREGEFARRIVAQTGRDYADAEHEVQVTLSRLFSYAAWTDKFVGSLQRAPQRGWILESRERLGVLGLAAPDEYPLLGLISLIAPAIAMGNTVVTIPSPVAPLSATDLYQVLETSDVPAGVINIVTGDREVLSQVLAEHHNVDALWYFGLASHAKAIELAALSNLKPTWISDGRSRDWLNPDQGEGTEFLRAATSLKTIWQPYGA